MKMVYDGPTRTVRHGPRVITFERGELEVHPSDVRVARELGAVPADEPAPEPSLSDRTVDELRELAKAADIEGRSNMAKAELVAALEAAEHPTDEQE